MGSMLGVALSENIIQLLIFWELTSLSSFLLIGFRSGKPEGRQGARMALAVTGGGGLALIGGLLLLILADDPLVRVGCAVWTLTAVLLFGHSAVYHRGRWTEKVEAVLRRVDHSNIAVFIAGTYTPLALALLEGTSRVVLLSVIWGCALAEVLFRTFWLGAPRWLYVALYIAMGWVALFWLPSFWASGGPAVVILLLAGGVCYTLGAVVYALKRPNPSQKWFGFHEIFHAGTILGAMCHWVAILLAVA